MYHLFYIFQTAPFLWLNNKTWLHCTEEFRANTSHTTAKQQLRTSAESYPNPLEWLFYFPAKVKLHKKRNGFVNKKVSCVHFHTCIFNTQQQSPRHSWRLPYFTWHKSNFMNSFYSRPLCKMMLYMTKICTYSYQYLSVGGGNHLCCHYLEYVASNVNMTGECWIRKNMEGSSHDLSRYYTGIYLEGLRKTIKTS
jgi:hypothetical protein